MGLSYVQKEQKIYQPSLTPGQMTKPMNWKRLIFLDVYEAPWEKASNLRRRTRNCIGCSRLFILILICAPVACDMIQSYHAMVVTFECYCNMKLQMVGNDNFFQLSLTFERCFPQRNCYNHNNAVCESHTWWWRSWKCTYEKNVEICSSEADVYAKFRWKWAGDNIFLICITVS